MSFGNALPIIIGNTGRNIRRPWKPDLVADDPDYLSLESTHSLDLLEPCGNGNPRPLLYLGELCWKP